MDKQILISISLEEFMSIIQGCVKTGIEDLTKNSIPQPEDEKLLSIQDVKNLMGVSKVTIHKWKKIGLIPYHKLNRRLYFKKKEILDALNFYNKNAKGKIR